MSTLKAPRVTKPWRRRRAQPHHREVMILDRPPLAQICVYEHCCVLTRRKRDGTWLSYPVSPDALAQALGKLPISTGLLPEGMIGNGLYQGDPFYALLVRPRRATLLLDDGGPKSKVIQTPPLVWAGWRSEYRIWALNIGPDAAVSPELTLYNAPFPNLYSDGKICWGSTTKRPTATPTTMTRAFTLFLEESRFNSHLASGRSRAQPANVLRAYDKLGATKPYPLGDLVPTPGFQSLRDVLSGAVWR